MCQHIAVQYTLSNKSLPEYLWVSLYWFLIPCYTLIVGAQVVVLHKATYPVQFIPSFLWQLWGGVHQSHVKWLQYSIAQMQARLVSHQPIWYIQITVMPVFST